MEAEETLYIDNLSHKAMLVSGELQDALRMLKRMNLIEMHEGMVSIIK